ncbi:MAG: hypothetical protein MRJ65_08050 [Candidatus Brocadiaceae bacterium]|nr:hypothetical protein [Candidatus Brocadiaceae bacterium]
MFKKFAIGLVVVGVLLSGVGVLNTVCMSSSMGEDKGKKEERKSDEFTGTFGLKNIVLSVSSIEEEDTCEKCKKTREDCTCKSLLYIY